MRLDKYDEGYWNGDNWKLVEACDKILRAYVARLNAKRTKAQQIVLLDKEM